MRKTLLSAMDGGDFEFNPSRLAVAIDTMQEWINSYDVPDDQLQDFMLARDSMDALYTYISRLPARSIDHGR